MSRSHPGSTHRRKPVRPEKEPEAAPALFQEQLLELIRLAGQECGKIQAEFGSNPPPELETLVKLHRVLVLRLAHRKLLDAQVLAAITQLMRPVMEYARLEEVRQRRELAEQKFQAERAAAALALAEQQKSADGQDAITPNTAVRIERELKLV